jgi:hypothetical protein
MLRYIVPRLIGPDFPSIETRQLGSGFQIDMFRPIRVDHTNCLQVVIKTHSFIMWKLNSRTCKKRVSLSINKVGVYQSGRSFWLCISKFFFIKNCTYTTHSAREFTVVNSLVVNSNHYTTTHNYTYTV